MKFPLSKILSLLEKEVVQYDVPVVDLIATQTKDPFRVLVATILSARTKDDVTAAACRRLFAQADTPESLAQLGQEEIEKLIFPVGFYRNKAKYLRALPTLLQENFQGQVPAEMDELLTLPGVGRKTANLVLAVAFNIPAICVDTHVHRIMNIWGYVTTETPLQTEMALREKLPEKYWCRINSLLVAYGQSVCTPVRPHCDQCVIGSYCPRLGVTPRMATVGKEKKSGPSPEKVFVSWNVNGLRAAIKNGFQDIFEQFNADIFALQEIKALPEQLPDWIQQLPNMHCHWFPAEKKGYSGTAVLSKSEPLQVMYGMGKPEFDCEGRVLTLEFPDFYFLCCYSPNAQPELKRLVYKQDFNKHLLAFMNELSAKKTVVLCGDLNVAHQEIDLANPKNNVNNPGFSPEERAWMDEVIAAGYVDTFRQFHQEPDQYTWWSYRFHARAKNIGWRIDYFLIDGASRSRLVDAAIHADVMGSDHCPVSIVFR